jgi:long-chain acyl-CoA synthetase
MVNPLYVTQHMRTGEYVAVERVENELGKADIVDQLWVYGNSFENNLVAVAVPHKVTLMGWASSQPGLEGLGYEDVCKRKEARTHVTQVLSSTGGLAAAVAVA